jgi:NADH-quinone oxidoreductase subunit N
MGMALVLLQSQNGPVFDLLQALWARIAYAIHWPLNYFNHWAWDNTAYYLIFPEIFLILGLVAIVIIDLMFGEKYYNLYIWLGIIATFLNFLMTIHMMYNTSRYYTYGLGLWWGGLETIDPFALFFKQLLDWGDIPLLLVMFGYGRRNENRTEFVILFLTATVAFDLMVGSSDLLAIYVMTEFGSLMLYLMTCSYQKTLRTLEAGLKYFFIGALSSASMLFGISMVYGWAGTTNLYGIKDALRTANVFHPIIVLSIIFIIVGIGYKVGVAPFHMWVPDTYQGAPIVVAAFLSIFPKIAGFAVIIRMFIIGFYYGKDVWVPIFIVMAILTMFVGNIMALTQRSFKRLMGYSGVAQMGYVMMGVVMAVQVPTNLEVESAGVRAALYYMLIYLFMNLVTFMVGMFNEISGGDDRLETFNGFIKRSPSLAVFLTISLLALTGIPPTAGFVAKFIVFRSVIPIAPFQPLVMAMLIAAAINAVIAVFYYVGIIKRVFFYEPLDAEMAKPYVPVLFQRFAILLPVMFIFLMGFLMVGVPYDYVTGAWLLPYSVPVA